MTGSLPWPPADNPDHEPFKILIKRDEFTDPSRAGRIVPFKLYYPVDHNYERLPLVVWSHGLGGSREGAGFLARYLAAHGYAVLNVQHLGTDASLWEGKPGHPWDVIRGTVIPREAFLNRFADIPFILDNIGAWGAENEAVSKYLDLSNIGISGHSLGALTAQVSLGQRYPDDTGTVTSTPDLRLKGGIFYSPIPAHFRVETEIEKPYAPIEAPTLHMTGTLDESPVEGFGYDKRLEVFENIPSPEKYLTILEGGDHMVFAGSRGQLGHNPRRGEHEAQIRLQSLAFWDAYLRDNDAARAWLAQQTNA